MNIYANRLQIKKIECETITDNSLKNFQSYRHDFMKTNQGVTKYDSSIILNICS